MPLLSVIVPVYNEVKTIRQILEKIKSIDIDKEVIVVDDGSRDGTVDILRDIKYDNLKVIYHSANRGKGAAFLTGLANATGEYVIIQDADLEYDPTEYNRLLDEIKDKQIDLVLGARFIDGHDGLFLHRVGNKFLTALFNFMFGKQINDCFTCYKLFRRNTINSLRLCSQKFDIEIEIIARVLKKGLKIKEVPISYYPRTYSEGKKIRWLDGLWAIFYMIKYRFVD